MSPTTTVPLDSPGLPLVGNLLLLEFLQSVLSVLSYGVFLTLYAQSTTSYIKRKLSNRNQLLMSFISNISFLLLTVNMVALLIFIGFKFHAIFIVNQDLSLGARLSLMKGQPMISKSSIVVKCSNNLLVRASGKVIISDSIVIWRAFILLQHRRRWLIALPLLLLLGSAAYFLVSLICERAEEDTLLGYLLFVGVSLRANRLPGNILAIGLSLGANVVATALIGYICWIHRRNMVAGLGQHKPTQVERLLFLLVESGVVFCLFQAVSLATSLPSKSQQLVVSAGLYARIIFDAMYFGFAAIYPTMVIVLVNRNRAFDTVYSITSSLQFIRGADPITPRHLGMLHQMPQQFDERDEPEEIKS